MMMAALQKPAPVAAAPRRVPRRGMTILEVLMALVILTGALLGMGKFITNFAHTSSTGAIASTAADLVQDRLEYVKTTAPYSALATYATIESAIPGHPGFTRETDVVRTNMAQTDYTTVTVTVTHASLTNPVSKTTIIGAF